MPKNQKISLVNAIPISCISNHKTQQKCCTTLIEEAFYHEVKSLGFEHARYTCWSQDISSTHLEEHSFSINFSNFPSAWEKEYEAKNYYQFDPLLRALNTEDKSRLTYGSWESARKFSEENPLGRDSEEQSQYKTSIEKLFFHAAEFGINSGIYMMLNLDIRSLIISLSSSKSGVELEKLLDEALYKKAFSLITLCDQALSMTNSCSQCLKSLRIGGGPSIKLTPMQIKILQSFATHSTATTADISRINNLTTHTINFHLKSIRAKFNKKNASGHALSAIAKEHGLI